MVRHKFLLVAQLPLGNLEFTHHLSVAQDRTAKITCCILKDGLLLRRQVVVNEVDYLGIVTRGIENRYGRSALEKLFAQALLKYSHVRL